MKTDFKIPIFCSVCSEQVGLVYKGHYYSLRYTQTKNVCQKCGSDLYRVKVGSRIKAS